jgi:tetratricopeptide (TPR) repeat protein
MSARRVLVLLVLACLAPVGGPAAAQDARSAEAGLTRYREAHWALAGGDYERARSLFDTVPADSILADYAVFFAAESLLRAGDEPAALERFRTFVERFSDSTLAPVALLALTDTNFRLGRWVAAEREARRFLSRAPNHPEAARVLVRLAETRAAQGFAADALADLRRRWIEAPASAWGEAAREVMEGLAAEHGLTIAPLSAEERLAQGQRFIEATDFAAAARALERGAPSSSRPRPTVCTQERSGESARA